MILPPGFDEPAFQAVLTQLRKAVGAENVYASPEDIALYKDAYSPLWGEPEERVASAAVAPANVEEVQAVVRIANAAGLPLYPISTGKNLGYGGAAPILSGSVVVDLKRMNRVIEVNEAEGWVLVEPGLSYFDLYNPMRERGVRLWIDPPDPGWGSPIGNALERGVGYTRLPYRDHWDAHCGLEVVLANGDVVRTGMGSLPGAQSWQSFRYGCGPLVDGLFSQSNFGIVTKMGFWLQPEPEVSLQGMISVPRYDDLEPFINLLGKLEAQGAIDSAYWIASPLLDFHRGAGDYGLGGKPDPAPDAWDAMAREHDLASWSVTVVFHGGEEVVEGQWKHVQRVFSAIPGARFSEVARYRHPLDEAALAKVPKQVEIGVPNLAIFSAGARTRTNQSPSAGHMWFSPVLPMNAASVLKARQVFGEAFRTWGINPITTGLPMHYHPRAYLMLFGFEISHDPAVNAKNREAMLKMVKLAAEHGWGEYRTHALFMDPVVDVFSFNDHALRRLQETLKDAVDPKGILSAGRYGLWPRAMRGVRQ